MSSEKIVFTGRDDANHPLPEVKAVQAVTDTPMEEQFDLLTLAERQTCGRELCGLSITQKDTTVKTGERRLPDGILLPLEEPEPRYEPVHAPRTNITVTCEGNCTQATCDRRVSSLARRARLLIDTCAEAAEEAGTTRKSLTGSARTEAEKIIKEAEEKAEAAATAIMTPAEEKAEEIKTEASTKAAENKQRLFEEARNRLGVQPELVK